MSPEYVTWTPGSSRSLRVTSAGHALLDTNIPQHLQDLPLPDTILPLLASGLTKLVAQREEGRIVQAPYPIAWRRALAMLSAECFQRGIFDAPATTVEALAWCRIPLTDWRVTFSSQFRTLDMPLLDEADEPTALCHEYAHVGPGDAELELSERIMLSVRATARAFRLPEAYVTFREFVITHPIVEQEELMRVSFDSRFDRLGSELNALYEPVPTTLAADGAIRTCGFCGWTLGRRNGRLRCGDNRCRLLTDDFREGTGRLSVPPERLLRVRPRVLRHPRCARRAESELSDLPEGGHHTAKRLA